MHFLNGVPDRKSRPFQKIIDVKSGFQSLISNPKKLNERLQELNPITTTTEQSTTSINSFPSTSSTKLDILITITKETSTENTMVIMYILF